MMRTATVQVTEFNEGTISLGSEFWFCTDHDTKMRAGKDCPFCVHERLGDSAEFEHWIASQRA